ncbi:MAG: ParB/RepB/Spo0J family partition protein [Persicimonas sp.]
MTESNDDNGAPKRRKALGRGLGALIPRQRDGDGTREYHYLPVDKISPAEVQPRRDFDESGLEELAASIAESGVIQPLVVREDGDGYELIAGERRWRAAKIAGEDEVPAVVREVTDAEAYALALVENVQREDLNPMEEASAYARLLEEYDFTQEELADQIGKSRSSIANAVRLLNLPQKVCDMVASGELSAGHARTLVGLSADMAKRLATRIVKRDLSVREAEKLVREKKDAGEGGGSSSGASSSRYRDDSQTRHITNELQHALGTRVKLKDKHGEGKVEIYYDDYDVLQSVLDRLGVDGG